MGPVTRPPSFPHASSAAQCSTELSTVTCVQRGSTFSSSRSTLDLCLGGQLSFSAKFPERQSNSKGNLSLYHVSNKVFEGLEPASQGRNLALTVLCVHDSLDSGRRHIWVATRTRPAPPPPTRSVFDGVALHSATFERGDDRL